MKPFLEHMGHEQQTAADGDEILCQGHAKIWKSKRFNQTMANLVTSKCTSPVPLVPCIPRVSGVM